MKRVINITENLKDLFAWRFNNEHAVPIRRSRLQLEHLHKIFEYFDKRLFELVGAVDHEFLCIFEPSSKDYFYVEREAFDSYIIDGYINKNDEES
jgi:hypothetical protein